MEISNVKSDKGDADAWLRSATNTSAGGGTRLLSASGSHGCGSYDELRLEMDDEGLTEFDEQSPLRHVEIHLLSIKCAGCVPKVEKLIKDISGVEEVTVNFVTRIAYVSYNFSAVDVNVIVEVMRKEGFSPVIGAQRKPGTSTVYFKVDGNIGECRQSVVDVGAKCDMIAHSKVRHKIMKVTYNKRDIGIRAIHGAITKSCPKAVLLDTLDVFPSEFQHEARLHKRLFIISFFFGLITMGLMIAEMVLPKGRMVMVAPGLSLFNLVLFVCAVLVQVLVGRSMYVSAYRSLFTGMNMDLLISTATFIAFVYSTVIVTIYMVRRSNDSPHTFFETPGMLYMIVTLGRWIENGGKRKTIDSIRQLMRPKRQRVSLLEFKNSKLEEYRVVEVDSHLLQENDYVRVCQGMKVPADGIVTQVEDVAVVDESIMTGESEPVIKERLAEVFSGTINKGCPFVIKVIRTGEDCRIQQISYHVQKALSKKIPISNVVNKVAMFFTPTIVVLGLITFSTWMVVFKLVPEVAFRLNVESPIQFSFQTAISVLCVACPCALGLAIPMAIMISTGVGASFGAFIKGGPPIQLLHKVKVVVFDKTGTITYGRSEVIKSVLFARLKGSNNGEAYFYSLVFSIASMSKHPLSVALAEYTSQINVNCNNNESVELCEVKECPGRGVKGRIVCKPGSKQEPIDLFLGNEPFMNENGIHVTQADVEEASLADHKGAIVYFGVGRTLCACFVLSDALRADAYYTIRHLRLMNIKTVLLTGDRKEAAEYVAKLLNFDKVYFKQTPEDKSHVIKSLIQSETHVAMVGDGINDSIALSGSTVGIAMGSGSDIAAESAGVVLMGNRLHDILNLIALSHLTIRTIHRNLILSSVYNILSVPVAAGCLKWSGIDIQPWIASIAMVVSSLSVIGSSLLIRVFKPPYSGVD